MKKQDDTDKSLQSFQCEHRRPTLSVSGVHQRGAGHGTPRARGVLEGEDGPPKLHHKRSVGAPAAEEEEHAVGAAAEQEEQQTIYM